jgi:hypothetical protein
MDMAKIGANNGASQHYQQVQMSRLTEFHSVKIEGNKSQSFFEKHQTQIDKIDIVSLGSSKDYSETGMKVLTERLTENLQKKIEGAAGNQGLEGVELTDAEAVAAAESDIHSPTNVSDRILDFALGFFSDYRQQAVDDLGEGEELDEDLVKQEFHDLISGAIDQGFEEARSVISSLGALEGETEQKINKTYDLVQAGLSEFLNGGNQDLATQIMNQAQEELMQVVQQKQAA